MRPVACILTCIYDTMSTQWQWVKRAEHSQDSEANELARSGDAGVGALCRFAHASGRHPASSTVAARVLSSLHLSSHRIISTSSVSSQTFHLPFTIPFTSPHSPVHSALAGLVARPAVTSVRSEMVLSATRPPSHYSSAVSVAAPCVGAPGCHGFSPL